MTIARHIFDPATGRAIFVTPDDPSVTGLDAPIGSLANRDTTGNFWSKFGSTNTDWAMFATASGTYLPLTGGTLSGSLTINPGVLVLGGSAGTPGGSTRYFGTGATSNSFWSNVPTGGAHFFAVNDVQVASISAAALTSQVGFVANGANTATRGLQIHTGGSLRWFVYGDNGTESGSNSGTAFKISRYSDAGTFLANALTIVRATGAVSVESLASAGTITGSGAVVFGPDGNLTPSSGTFGSVLPGIRLHTSGSTNPNLNLFARSDTGTAGNGVVISYFDSSASNWRAAFDIRNTAGLATLNLMTAGGTVAIGGTTLTLDGATTTLAVQTISTYGLNFLTGGAALRIRVGGILVSSAYSNDSLVPTNGIYSSGGITTAGTLTVATPTASNIILNTTSGATSDGSVIQFQRGGSIKWRIGTNIVGTNTDELNIYTDVSGAYAVRITTAGNVTVAGSLNAVGVGSQANNDAMSIRPSTAGAATYLSFWNSAFSARQGYVGFGNGTNSNSGTHIYLWSDFAAAAFGGAGGAILLGPQLIPNTAGAGLGSSSQPWGEFQSAGGIRQAGTVIVRIENIAGTIPAGSTGPGLEMGVNSGTPYLQSYNRSTSAYGPMNFYGSSFVLSVNGSTNTTINASGVTSPDFILSSDRRLKQDLRQIDGALDRLERISGYTFAFTAEPSRRRAGVIAQEVRGILPEAVITGADGMLAVSYDALAPLLIEAIKELRAEVRRAV